jgi:aryl-alcohol dehydrogenase-like predicted oxidoreductase
MSLSTVGFGAWAIGGGDWAFSWGPQDDAQSIAAMHRAVDLGINWIDTAAVYGLGHSEEVVGRFLKERAATERPLVFSKCGRVWNAADRMASPVSSLKPESIRRECEASLRRLGVERIDLYQFHWPDDGTPLADSWAEMGRVIDEGKVRFGAVSNYTAPLLDRLEAIRHVESLQPPFSLVRRDAAARELPWCNAHRTGVICYSPMQSGILTDTFTRDRITRMSQDDWRRRAVYFQEPNLSANIALRDALRPIAARHAATVAAVAIAWTLAWPGVTGAIVGARSAAQIDGWIGGATLVLTQDDLREIAVAIGRTGAGSGPTLPQ